MRLWMSFHHSLNKNNFKFEYIMKRIFCVLLSVLFFSTTLTVSPLALGLERQSEWYTFEALEDEYYFPKKNTDFVQPNMFYSGSSYKFRNFLTDSQKLIYDLISKYKGGLLGEPSYSDEAQTIPVFKIQVKFPDGAFLVNYDTRQNDVTTAVIGAMTAAIDDFPEYFWLGGFSYSCNYSTNDSGKYYVKNFTLLLPFDTGSYANCDTVISCYNQLMAAVDSFDVKGTARYEKVKYIHDSICKMTTYTECAMAHQPTGVFLNGKAVCEGYAEAFKLLCDRENIPCLLVVGTGNGGAHKWNYVRMDDGKWYGMDATWDDQGDRIYYDYFLTGSESINAVFGKTKFGNGTDTTGDHINTGTHFGGYDFALSYPTVSKQSYTGVIQMWNSEASFDNTRNFMFIPKDAVANQQILCTYYIWAGNAPSTNAATVTGVTTGGKVNITSPVSMTYTIVRFGDVNKDNRVDNNDYSDVRDIVTCKTGVYTDKAQFEAADMNGDGVIDAFDAIYLDLYYRDTVD